MKKKNLFMSATIMFGLLALASTFKNEHVTWIWADKKPIAVMLGILGTISGILWIKQQRLTLKADGV